MLEKRILINIRILLSFLLLIITTSPLIGQDTGLEEAACSKDYLNARWAKISEYLLADEHHKVISLMNEILTCKTKQEQEYFDLPLEHITGAKVYIARAYLFLEELDSAKFYLDGLNDDLISYDEENTDLKLHCKLMGYLYGVYYKKKGFYELATVHFENTIDKIFEEIHYNETGILDKEALAEVYWFSILDLFNDAAVDYTRIGDFGKANLYFEIALEFSNSKNKWQLATVHQNLAWSYSNIRKYDQALEHFNKVEELLEGNKNKNYNYTLGITYKNRAEYYYNLEKIDSALIYVKKALLLDIEDWTQVYTNQLYVRILMKEKRFEEANKKITIAKEYTRSSQGERHPEMAENYQLEADLYHAQKKYSEADQKYNKALGILTQQKICNCKNLIIEDVIEKRMSMNIIRNKAKNLFLIKGNEEWKDCYHLLNKLTRELNNKYILSESSKYNLAQEAKVFYEEAIAAFIAKDEKEEAYEFSRLAKGMVLMQQIQDKKAIEAGFIPKERVERGRNLRFKINELQKIKGKAFIDNELIADTEKKILAIENQYEKWVEEIEKEYPAYYQLKYNGNVEKLDKIQHEIANRNATVLEYFLGENQLYLFIVNENNIEAFLLDLDDDLKSNINRLHEIISNNIYDIGSFNEFTEISFHLYKTLISKAANGNYLKENIIIIPDEEINLISFEALITEEFRPDSDKIAYDKLDYLLEKYNVSYQYSANLIPDDGNNKIKNKFLGIAPSFNNKHITPLRYNKKEILSINDRMNGKILLNTEGTYTNFIKDLDDHNIIHFATHAVFNDQIPLDSRIELTDTSLYIYELLALEHKLDLVVLSACETASGKRLKGEGVISLSRALIQSGCQTVISSLWKVSDQKAGQLMNSFYDHFSKNENTKKSLSLAKREFLSKTISRNTHPFYWAGFVQIGKPLELDNGWPIYYWFIIGSIIFCISIMAFKNKGL